MQARVKDLFETLNLPLSRQDRKGMNSFVAHFPSAQSIFNASPLDGESSISLEYPQPFATAIRIFYRGLDARFSERYRPNLSIEPTEILVLLQRILMGSRGWTEEEVDGLKLLSSHVNFRTVKYQLEAFHEGIAQCDHSGEL